MLLRALAGPYAGQIRDYAPQAVIGALRTGMAERVETETPSPAPVTVKAATKPAMTSAKRSGR